MGLGLIRGMELRLKPLDAANSKSPQESPPEALTPEQGTGLVFRVSGSGLSAFVLGRERRCHVVRSGPGRVGAPSLRRCAKRSLCRSSAFFVLFFLGGGGGF